MAIGSIPRFTNGSTGTVPRILLRNLDQSRMLLRSPSNIPNLLQGIWHNLDSVLLNCIYLELPC